MFRFYIAITCPECDEDVHLGPIGTFLDHAGLPVVPLDTAAQSRFDCSDCDAKIYTGDFDDFHVEPGDGPLEAEEGDDGLCGDCAEGRCHGDDPEDCGCDRHDASKEN